MRTISQGATGPTVALLQDVLKDSFAQGGLVVDGIFGPLTAEALRRAQRLLGVDEDGIAGRSTWAVLLPTLRGEGSPVAPRRAKIVHAHLPYSATLLHVDLVGLAVRYPKQVTIQSIGTSLQGKPLFCVTIGHGPKRVGYNAAHHANEWLTTPLLMQFIESLCEGGRLAGYAIAPVLQKVTFDLVPMVNPDGVDMVTGDLPPDHPTVAWARDICRAQGMDYPNDWKANAAGVDLNLQYPAGWEVAAAIKAEMGITGPAPQSWPGEISLNQPESQAMARRAREADYALTLAYHTQGREIYWKYADYEPARSYTIGRSLAALTGYALEITPYASGHAGYKDWFIQAFDRPGYTIEAGLGRSPLPLSQLPQITIENLPALLLAPLM